MTNFYKYTTYYTSYGNTNRQCILIQIHSIFLINTSLMHVQCYRQESLSIVIIYFCINTLRYHIQNSYVLFEIIIIFKFICDS